MYLFLLLLVPVGIGLTALILGKGKITVVEFLIQELVMVLIMILGVGIARSSVTADTEFLNGRVTNKLKERESCEHSYSCRCRDVSDSDGEGSHRECDTCYEHSYDVSWYVYTSINRTIRIARIDRQGVKEPERWTQAYIGEPIAVPNAWVNYVKASPDTILRRHFVDEEISKVVPPYPIGYDYYRANRFITVGATVRDPNEWLWLIDQANADLGAMKQVNIIVIVTGLDSEFEYAIEDRWIGVKKNDMVVIIGSKQPPKIDWVRIMSWSTATDLKVELRDEIQAIGTLGKRDDIIASIRAHVTKQFVRRDMNEFKYLAASFQPGSGATLVLFLLGVCISVGASIFFYKNEFTEVHYDAQSSGYRSRVFGGSSVVGRRLDSIVRQFSEYRSQFRKSDPGNKREQSEHLRQRMERSSRKGAGPADVRRGYSGDVQGSYRRPKG